MAKLTKSQALIFMWSNRVILILFNTNRKFSQISRPNLEKLTFQLPTD